VISWELVGKLPPNEKVKIMPLAILLTECQEDYFYCILDSCGSLVFKNDDGQIHREGGPAVIIFQKEYPSL